MTINAGNFGSRQGIEAYIKAKCGANMQANKDAGHLIKGTTIDLKRLFLSDTTTIWGIPCEDADQTPEVKYKKKKK